MKYNQKRNAGFSLVELSVVIFVVLLLTYVANVGIQAWRESTAKSNCLVTQTSVQNAVRSYANLNQLNTGDTLASTSVIGSGKLLEAVPKCSANGNYTYLAVVPASGTAYMTCSVTTHAPSSTVGW